MIRSTNGHWTVILCDLPEKSSSAISLSPTNPSRGDHTVLPVAGHSLLYSTVDGPRPSFGLCYAKHPKRAQDSTMGERLCSRLRRLYVFFSTIIDVICLHVLYRAIPYSTVYNSVGWKRARRRGKVDDPHSLAIIVRLQPVIVKIARTVSAKHSHSVTPRYGVQ